MAKPIPDGFHTITPHLVIRECAKALDWYRKAFGAEVLHQSPGPGGLIMHAMMRIGDSFVMMADEFPDMEGSRSPASVGGTTVVLNIYCADVDAWYDRAVKAGATARMPPADMFWGDRYSQLTDPFGHAWAIATHKEDVTPQQMAERQEAWMKEFGEKK